jgi:galactoside O-acetyltransferase
MNFLSPEGLRSRGFLSIGENVRISRNASFHGASRIALGTNCRIDDFCVVSAGEGGIHIGRNVHIAIMTSLMGKGHIYIGDFCNLSSRVSIYSSSDDYSGEYLTNPTIPEAFTHVDHRGVTLERHVIIGSGTIVLPGVTIGEGAAVGALSLVTKDLEPFSIYAGSPLRLIKSRSKRLLELEKQYVEGGDLCLAKP